MTVTHCKIRKGTLRLKLGIEGQGGASAVYDIDTDTDLQDYATVLSQAQDTGSGFDDPLPARYSAFSVNGWTTDSTAFVTSVELRPHPHRLKRWEASVTWGPLPGGSSNTTDPDGSPLDHPPIAWVEYSTISEELSQAYNVDEIAPLGLTARPANTLGPIINGAGKDYDEALYSDRRIPTIVISKNYSSYVDTLTLNNAYGRTLNSEALFGGSVGVACARFDGAQCGKPAYQNGVRYYETEIRITISRNPWYREIVNRGFHYRAQDDSGSYVDKRAVDEDTGTPSAEPVLLASNGALLGDTLGNTIRYREHELVSYTPLEQLVYTAGSQVA